MDTNTNTLPPAGQIPGVGSDGLLCFQEFPKMARLSRECIISDLTSSAFSPYFVYGYNEEEKSSDAGTKEGCCYTTAKVGGSKQGETQLGGSGVSCPQVCDGRAMAGRGRKGYRAQGVDGRTEIKAMHRLRRHIPDLLHGFRPSQGREESLQHRLYVRASLQPRTHSNRSGQMRLGLCQLPQNTNP